MSPYMVHLSFLNFISSQYLLLLKKSLVQTDLAHNFKDSLEATLKHTVCDKGSYYLLLSMTQVLNTLLA